MFDLVTKEFFENIGGTEPFRKGQDIDNTLLEKESKYVINTRLPRAYQEIEYIESNRKQFIKTNYVPKINTKIELILSFSGTFQTTGTSIFAAPDGEYTFGINYGGQTTQDNTLFPWADKTYSNGGTICSFNITDEIRTNKNLLTFQSESVTYGAISNSIARKTRDSVNSLYIFGTKAVRK